MEQDRVQELIAGLALNTLDEQEEAEARQLLESDEAARLLYEELLQTVNLLAYTAEPAPLPEGSLGRLRQKAGVAPPLRLQVQIPNQPTGSLSATRTENTVFPTPLQLYPTRSRKPVLAYAAALVFAVLAGLFAILWTTGRSSYEQELTAILASPNLKVTELKSDNPAIQSTVRVYADPITHKAYMVTNNMDALPGDKVYEAWIITDQNEPLNAGLVGAGGGGVYKLDTRGNLANVKLFAITVEKSGGVAKPSQAPIMAGQLSG